MSKLEYPASKERFWLLLILVAIIISFFPLFKAEFTRWDDNMYVLDNDLITSLSLTNIKRIFSTESVVALNYHPITILSLAIDYWFAKLNPAFYHIVNIIIHAINSYLVFIFIKKLSGNNSIIGLITALFFGIHPMHVESVAWIAERKDVLYTFFFVAGMITHLKFLDNGKMIFLFFTFMLYAASVLSKAMAVVFPVIMILIDYYKHRKFSGKTMLEKIPFFIFALPFSLLTLEIQKSAIAKLEVFTLVERIGIGFYGLMNYVWKLFLPLKLSPYYPYPLRNSDGTLPVSMYIVSLAGILLVIAVLIWIIMKKKNYRVIFFGFMFYLTTVILVLQFLSVGSVIVADRYSYLSYIGLIFMVVMLVYNFVEKRPAIKKPIFYSVIVVALIFTTASNVQSRIWNNQSTLWTRVIERYPNRVLEIAHEQRGSYRSQVNDLKGALEDYEKALGQGTKQSFVYFNSGVIYGTKGNEAQQNGDMKTAFEFYQKAIDLISKGLLLDSNWSKGYIDRATTYVMMGKFDLAATDYTKALEAFPANQKLLEMRAYVNGLAGNTNESIEDYTTLISIEPSNLVYYMNRGVASFNGELYEKAISDFKVIIQNDSSNADAFMNLAKTYEKIGDNKKFLENMTIARRLGLKESN